ncbi:hypothetical protein NQZ79_g7862 [Umbelopsis isabellina]|nr:hypothetical protein NQZ79_g7862 [Umbelopsis isabellina]
MSERAHPRLNGQLSAKSAVFFHRKSVASNESAMNHSTFHPGWDGADIRTRNFDDLLSDCQEDQSMEDIDEAFDKLIKEYGLPSNLKPNLETLTLAQKKTLLDSYRLAHANRVKPTSSGFSTDRMKMLRPLSILTKDAGTKQHTGNRRQRANSKMSLSPDQAAHMLHISNINTIDIQQVTEIHILLKSTVTSWSIDFLKIGGYGGLASQLQQLKNLSKRTPQHAKILQMITRCIKALMTHEFGIQKLLTEPTCLRLIRDLLFSPTASNRKSLYAFDIQTRSLMLDVLCNLTAIQTSGDGSEYVHGWDLLLSLLQDTNNDKERLAEEERRKSRIPFPIANETQAAKTKAPCRFTSWMRELMFILDKYIEPISFLAGALDFRFESAYRQLRVSHEKGAAPNLERDGGSVMVDEGVVEYLITHLRLICTVITNPPTCYKKDYTASDQELVRLEFMSSGFERVSRGLRSCPHPTLLHSYINYLAPLVTPWATLNPIETLPDQEQHVYEDSLVDEVIEPSPPVSIKGLTDPPATEQSKAFAQAEISRVNRQDKHKEIQSIKLNSIRVSDKEEFVQWQEEIRTMDTSSSEELSIDSPPRSHVWLAKAELDAEMDYYEQDDYDDIIEQPVTTYWMKGGR